MGRWLRPLVCVGHSDGELQVVRWTRFHLGVPQDFESLLKLAVGYADVFAKGVDDVQWDKDAQSFHKASKKESAPTPEPEAQAEVPEPEDVAEVAEPVEDSPLDAEEDLVEGEREVSVADESYNANLSRVQSDLPDGLYAIPDNPMQEAAWNAAKQAVESEDIQEVARRTASATSVLWEGGEAYAASSEWPSEAPADPQEVDPSVVNAFQGVEGFTAEEIIPYWREAWEAEQASREMAGIYDSAPSVSAVAARVVDALKAIYTPAS